MAPLTDSRQLSFSPKLKSVICESCNFLLCSSVTVLSLDFQLTLQSNTVHGERPGQLGGNLHAATNQGLPKHMLEGLVKGGAIAQFADHGNGILKEQIKYWYKQIIELQPSFEWLTAEYTFVVIGKIEDRDLQQMPKFTN